ncbi:MAG TPA: AgmX/PglI C-terminal domain-containing protein [Polyangiaceae bacterium]|nr:AgmX/PglI C-terminal domain-containing protein [Polyangiaceae bacterium]
MPRSRRAAALIPVLPALPVLAVLAGFALPVIACGGGTPKPKDEGDDNATAAAKSSGDDSTASAPASSAAPAPADSSPPAPPPAASAASGDIKATGGDDPWMAAHQMTPKDVMKTMRPAQGKVQACFKAGLKRDGSTNGEVKIRFVITNDGAVRVWRDDGSSMTDGDVTQCVGALVQKLKFPKQKSPGDAWGSYSINFTP